MKLSNYTLQPPLADHIESIFHFKDFIPDHSVERLVPTGNIFIIFELDGIQRNTFDNITLEPLQAFNNVWICGVHQNYISISAHKNSEMLVIQFKHAGAYPFIHIPLNKLSEKVLQAQDVFGREILELRNAIYHTTEINSKCNVVEKWLLKRYQKRYSPPAEIINIVSTLKSDSAINIFDVLHQYSKTHKQLIVNFKKYVGLTPKYFHRIMRFNELLQKIYQKQTISWAAISYECGYSDQSHFIKDFKHFSGFNPAEFIQKEYNQNDPNFFPIEAKG